MAKCSIACVVARVLFVCCVERMEYVEEGLLFQPFRTRVSSKLVSPREDETNVSELVRDTLDERVSYDSIQYTD